MYFLLVTIARFLSEKRQLPRTGSNCVTWFSGCPPSLIFLKPNLETLDFFDLLWIVGIADFVLKYITIALKCLIVALPKIILAVKSKVSPPAVTHSPGHLKGRKNRGGAAAALPPTAMSLHLQPSVGASVLVRACPLPGPCISEKGDTNSFDSVCSRDSV